MTSKEKTKRFFSEIILIILTIIMLIPVYYMVISAFKLRMDILKAPLKITPALFTTRNFSEAYRKVKLWKSFNNTGIITVMSMVFTVIASSLAGFACARIKARRFSFAYTFLVSLMVIPFVGCLIPLVVMMNAVDLHNSLWSCILIQAGWNLPFAAFLYTGFMKGVPGELEEAAIVDGCSLFGTYWKIFLPMLKPVTSTCIIKQGIGIWQDYLVCSSFLNSSKTPTVMVSVKKFNGQYVNEYGEQFAAVFMFTVPMIIVFVMLQKYFVKGIAAGAVKG